jgi:hypothetical protein
VEHSDGDVLRERTLELRRTRAADTRGGQAGEAEP